MAHVLSPYRLENLPESLKEWARLSHECERAAEKGHHERAEELYPQVMQAWENAPLRDRLRTDIKGFFALFRERHEWRAADEADEA